MHLRVLVVDDDPQIRDLVDGVLSEDADVVGAPDGESALRELNAGRYGCVILDVMMPGMSGYGVLEKVRADPVMRHMPVIMLTALAGESNHLEAFRDGADAYLTKPFDVDDLLGVVTELAGLDGPARAQRRREELDQAELLARIEASFGRA